MTWISIIVSVISCLGTILTCYVSLKVNQAVTNTKLDELTREVREHNNFARRMPVVEEKIKHLEEEIDYVEKIR